MNRHGRLLTGLLLSTACSACAKDEDAAETRDAFVAYWADGDEWCEHQAACGISSEAECLASWVSTSELRAAIDVAELDAAALRRCEESTRAFDECYFGSSCTEPAEVVCAAESERFDIDCAALLAALESTGSGASDVDLSAVSASLCDKSEECDGAPLSAAERASCEDAARLVFGLIVPDPTAAAQCVEQTPCADFETDIEAAAHSCIDIQTAECTGDGLFVCNSAGDCLDVACADACAFIGATLVGCSFVASVGHDQCECAF